MSEQSILKMFKKMQADIPQQTLNKWMHKVLKRMRDCLDGPLKNRLRQSTYTQNDETRLSVRSKDDKTGKYSYHTEYVHAMLSPEMKLVYMTYNEGSRSHKIQKEIIEGSNIHAITCDKAAIYKTLEKCFEEYGLVRSSCWFHGRHKLTDAYLTDHRMGSAMPFIYSILERCKLNDISFGDYIEDVCTRIMHGDSDYKSMLPCDYNPQKSAATAKAVA